MLQVAEYRSVPLRKTKGMSPSRQAVMEVFLKDQQESSQSVMQAEKPAAEVAPAQIVTPQQFRRSSSNIKPSVVNLVNFELIPISGVINSPRSLRVCDEMGIDVQELIPKPIQAFRARDIPETIALLRYEHFEARRQEKLQLLRSERQKRIESEHSTSEVAPFTQPVGMLPQYTKSLVMDPNTPNTSKRIAAPSPAVARPALSQRFIQQKSNTSVAPSISDDVREQRTLALMEKENRRKLVYEKAIQLQAEKQLHTVQKQVFIERKAAIHVHQYNNERATRLELQKLRRQDTFDNIKHQKRATDFAKDQQRQRAASVSRSVSTPRIDPYQLSLAKAAYMTPRQRAQRIRSCSAQRSSSVQDQ